MADQNSPEQIAYTLFQRIASLEGKALTGVVGQDSDAPDRKWVLDTYGECIEAVTGNRPWR